MPSQIWLTLLVMSFFALSACKRPVENPTSLDPIYRDLEARQKATMGEIAKVEGNIENMKQDIAALQPGDNKVRPLTRKLNTMEKARKGLQEQALYYQIRANQRKQFDEIEYQKAFAADKPWPDKEEFVRYEDVQKLRSAPRSWDARVPKLTRYNKPNPNAKPAEKPKSAHGEGGGEAEKPAGGH